METDRNKDIKHVYVRERQTDDVFRFWKAATVDEIQPDRLERERVRSPYAGHRERKFFKSSATFALLLVSTIFAAGIATTHQTLSYFNDLDSSNANSLNAGILDLEINGVEIDGELDEGDIGFVADPSLSGVAGSFNMEYKVRAEKISGAEPFCSLIQASIDTEGIAYDGPLYLFEGGPSQSVGINSFALSLPDATGVSNGDECAIDLVYTAWAKDAVDEQGYIDEERVHITVKAGGLPEQAPALFSAFGLFDTGKPPAEETEKKLPEEGDESESDEMDEEGDENNRERGVRGEGGGRPTQKDETPADPPTESTESTDTPTEPKPEPSAEQEPPTPPVEEVAPPVVGDMPAEPETPVEPAQPEIPAEPVQPEQPPAPEIPPAE